ncbi:MAG: serine/threonine-protein kinase [Myxococcota bacterium]
MGTWVGELVFGRYRVLHRMAGGGMAEVYLAQQESLPGAERYVILKSPRLDAARQLTRVARFLDEARVAAQLNHPNVVALLEAGAWKNATWIAMEHVHGVDVGEIMVAAVREQQRLPVLLVAHVLMQAAEGLQHAHTAVDRWGKPLRVVHRDVSPQNLMVRSDGLVKVLDFGVARADNRVEQTQGEAIRGRLAYLSPEMILGTGVDGRADQFALGVVGWEMCANRRLFMADSQDETLHRVATGAVPSLAEVAPETPAALVEIITRMLQRDPAARFPDCAAVAHALRGFILGLTRAPVQPIVAAYVQESLGATLEERARVATESAAAVVRAAEAARFAQEAGTDTDVNVQDDTTAVLSEEAQGTIRFEEETDGFGEEQTTLNLGGDVEAALSGRGVTTRSGKVVPLDGKKGGSRKG